MIIQIKENAAPQCWWEENENSGYRVCLRKLIGDFFKTSFINCNSKDDAIKLVKKIRDNGYNFVSQEDEKPCTDNCTITENSNLSNGEDGSSNEEVINTQSNEEKGKATFEFADKDDLEQKYSKIPRYDEMPDETIQETGTGKPIRFGNVQIGNGIL